MTRHLLLAMPESVVSVLTAEAQRRGVPPETLLVELIASRLPDALRDAIFDSIVRASHQPNETPPDHSDGVPDPHLPQFEVIPSVAPGCDLADEGSTGGPPH